jgi:hypothetical protein
MNRLCCPFGAGMIAEGALLSTVRSVVCLEKRAVVMIPLGCHDGEHLTTLQGHFDYVLIRKTESTLCGKFTCYKNVHPKVESGSRAI